MLPQTQFENNVKKERPSQKKYYNKQANTKQIMSDKAGCFFDGFTALVKKQSGIDVMHLDFQESTGDNAM